MGNCIEVTVFIVVLSVCISSVSEQESSSYEPVPYTSDEPVAVYAYMFDNATIKDVCPVLVPATSVNNDVLVQPAISIPHFGGHFFTSPGLDRTLFGVSHINGSCRRTGGRRLSQMCDQLLIRRVGTLELGNFSFQYVPVGWNQAIQLNVVYGPEGLAYLGDQRPNTLNQLGLEDRLTFELRATSVSSFEFTVCESIDNSAFVKSIILLASTARSLDTCIQAFGSFSTPYRIEVSFNHTIINPSVLTRRKIKLVMGSFCDSSVSSRLLDVVGYSVRVMSSSISISPTPATIHATVSTTLSPSLPPTSSTTPRTQVDIIAGSVFAIVVIAIVTGTVVVCLVRRRCRKGAGGGSGGHTTTADFNGAVDGTVSSTSLIAKGEALSSIAGLSEIQDTDIDSSPPSTAASMTKVDDLQSSKSNLTSKSKGKNNLKKSWPLLKSVPKLDGKSKVSDKQHSSSEDGSYPILMDIQNKVHSLQKSVENIQEKQDASVLQHYTEI